uniref:RNA-directed DNA polymerase, eukaryota, reverse transcriptase zinc-binding domain protein n=1 Tax=Tanacetum cinerariifolium TaxID=118510 RepID=A0A6L2KB03_TANCI|nr:RNA-directed DNA polymerase, eukaryota, reverse transcriptase zinc-binding domain protein [Tanacetum cinerariifolium]
MLLMDEVVKECLEEYWSYFIRTECVCAVQINVASKLAHENVGSSLRRIPRGGAELEQFTDMIYSLDCFQLPNMQDRWIWSLSSSGDFSVASVRQFIDDYMLLECVTFIIKLLHGGMSVLLRFLHTRNGRKNMSIGVRDAGFGREKQANEGSQCQLQRGWTDYPQEPLTHEISLKSLYPKGWERYNDMLYKCPTYDINSHQKVNIFYNGLGTMSRQLLDPEGADSWNIYSSSNYEEIAAIVNKLDILGRDMKKLKEDAHAIQVG